MLKDSLKKFGLSDKEAALYLILLELGKAKVQDIARKTKLPRSTVYSVLGDLQQQGLVFAFDQGKIRYFAPQDPGQIVQEMAARTESIKSIFPDLRQLYRAAKARPQIRYYEGVAEIKAMYLDILKMKGLKAYDIIAAEEEWLKLDSAFFRDFKERRAAAGIKTRLILEHSQAALDRKAHERESNSEVKLVPPGLGWKFTAGCYIFTDRVIFIAYKEERVACEIHSAEIAVLLKLLFEFSWKSLA